LAGEEFAVVAADEEGDAVQVAAERLKAVGGVAYAAQK
jgi:GGDEF domain-containing protein